MAIPQRTYWSKLAIATAIGVSVKQFNSTLKRLNITTAQGRAKYSQLEAKNIIKNIFPDLEDEKIMVLLGFKD